MYNGTVLPNKAGPRLRDFATAPARGITQPVGHTLFGSPVAHKIDISGTRTGKNPPPIRPGFA